MTVGGFGRVIWTYGSGEVWAERDDEGYVFIHVDDGEMDHILPVNPEAATRLGRALCQPGA